MFHCSLLLTQGFVMLDCKVLSCFYLGSLTQSQLAQRFLAFPTSRAVSTARRIVPEEQMLPFTQAQTSFPRQLQSTQVLSNQIDLH